MMSNAMATPNAFGATDILLAALKLNNFEKDFGRASRLGFLTLQREPVGRDSSRGRGMILSIATPQTAD